jgi:hypothetical protein
VNEAEHFELCTFCLWFLIFVFRLLLLIITY